MTTGLPACLYASEDSVCRVVTVRHDSTKLACPTH